MITRNNSQNIITDSCGSRCTDLYQVALHELGHNLGLEHSNVRNSIMYPILLYDNTGLHSDDIAGIQALYGRPKPDNNKPTTPSPPSGKKAYTPTIKIFCNQNHLLSS